MKIYIRQSTNVDKTRSFLLTQMLSETAKNQSHTIVEDQSEADLILILGDSSFSDPNLEGKKVFFVDVEKAFHAPEETLQSAVLKSEIYKNHQNTNKKNIVAVTACPTGVIQTFMSAEAIAEYAKKQGWNIKVETRGQQGASNLISSEDVINADLVFIATDIEVDLSKFEGKPMYRTSTNLALKKTAEEFEKAFKNATIYTGNKKNAQKIETSSISDDLADLGHKNIVAVTACPTGVVQTFMSAEAIAEYAKKQDWDIKVETRGQQGASNLISPEDVEKADLVFLATDVSIDLSKFKGKLMYHTSTNLALKKTAQEFAKAFKEARIYNG